MNDQPEPTGDGQEVWQLVIQDLMERVELGRTRYGTTLRTHNCRDALVDFGQELIDGLMYWKQHQIEFLEITDELEYLRAFHRLIASIDNPEIIKIIEAFNENRHVPDRYTVEV